MKKAWNIIRKIIVWAIVVFSLGMMAFTIISVTTFRLGQTAACSATARSSDCPSSDEESERTSTQEIWSSSNRPIQAR